MNQSNESALLILLYDSISFWIGLSQKINVIQNKISNTEEKIAALESKLWEPYITGINTELLYDLTKEKLKDKLAKYQSEQNQQFTEFKQYVDDFNKTLQASTNSTNFLGQALKNVGPGKSFDSLCYLISLGYYLLEAFFNQIFFNKHFPNAKNESLKFLNENLTNQIQECYNRLKLNL